MTSENNLTDLEGSPSSLNMLIVLIILFGISFFTVRYIENNYAELSPFLPGIGAITELSITWLMIKKTVYNFVVQF